MPKGELSPTSNRRTFSSDNTTPPPNSAEEKIVSRLRSSLPGCTDVAVVDVSGGCGAMYEVYVEAEEFRGVRMVRQHQMVTAALKEEIKDMHGLRISTAVPNKDDQEDKS